MEVFEFKKSLLTRLEDCNLVLSWDDKLITASDVRDEWSYYIQLQAEPTGWQALWKIPRIICEDLKIPYPTVVFGIVEQVIYNDLKAVFIIQAVEEEDIHLPEKQEVNLEDLYPTKLQENDALNIEKTAESIDNLRFFYKHVWMPWDNDSDDDLDWGKKHLKSRIQFYYDLQKTIKRPMANHILNLLREARYLYSKKRYIEMDIISDDESMEKSISKTCITDLMKMHTRLTLIKNEIELVENSEIRNIYEDLKINEENTEDKLLEKKVILIIRPGTIEEQTTALEMSKEYISKTSVVRICSTLQEALNNFQTNDEIFINSGTHKIKFFDYFNKNGYMCGLYSNLNSCNKTIINAADNENYLFAFDGEFVLQNLILNCNNVRTGIVVKGGKIKIINCHIIGNNNSSKQCFYICGNSTLILENSRIENFGVGIKLCEDSSAILNNSVLNNCTNAIEINHDSKISCEKVEISNSKSFGIIYECHDLDSVDWNQKVLNDFSELETKNLPWNGQCIFKQNSSNIIIYNRKDKSYKEMVDVQYWNESFIFSKIN